MLGAKTLEPKEPDVTQLSKEALELIQQTAQKAQAPQVIPVPGELRLCRVVMNGQTAMYAVPPTPREHTIQSIADLIEYANQEWIKTRSVVWHEEGEVVLVIDDEDRHDTIRFFLTRTIQAGKLFELANRLQWFDQLAFVRMLRLDLRVDPTIVGKFRRLDWSQGTTASQEAMHGRDRLGKQIQAEVRGIDELPEEIVVRVPLYREPAEDTLYDVLVLVEIDTTNNRLALIPAPGELDHVVQTHQMGIRQRLEDGLSDTPAFYGSP